MFQFDWDPAKAASNLRKHKVDFTLAATVFADRLATSIADDASFVFEERWITIGEARNGQLLVVCHTFSEDDAGMYVRIISARPATRKEQQQYKLGE